MEFSISLQGVTKTFDELQIGPIDLQIEPGFVVALVGPNGSGKSTLFRMLMNLIPADRGSIQILGCAPAEAETEWKRRIGYVPDTAYGMEELTAAEAGAFLRRLYPNWDAQRYEDLLKRYEINPKRKFKKLSKGTQRKLSVALALTPESELLLLDEPTANLDPFAAKRVLEDIATYVEAGERSVLIATHNLEEVRRVADYVAFLCKGRLLGVYEKDAVLDSWKAIWIDRPFVGMHQLPGVVEVHEGVPTRLITSDVHATEPALRSAGVQIVKVLNMELDDILAGLMQKEGVS